MRLVALALLAPLTGMTGCFAEGYSMKDRVTEAARLYNEGVRWYKLDQAVPYVPKGQQHAFVERMAALEDELEFADSEMVQLEVDKKHDQATARMTYTWMLKRRGLLEKTSTEQTWVERDGKWVVKSEVRLRGSPLAIWKERAEMPVEGSPEAAADKEPEREAQGAAAGGPGPLWSK